MAEITQEMRDKLRIPLPTEAVSQHPTKPYLSSIKSIYVAERINDVFGVGSWTLKSEIIERLEKFIVVKAILEIPEVGFYGEAYGGNDNADIGDAYKGATTDGFTKIAGQQLEIGIDVFKGISTKADQRKPSEKPSEPKAPQKSDQKATPPTSSSKKPSDEPSKAPPLKDRGELFTRATKFGLSSRDVLSAIKEVNPAITTEEQIVDYDAAWKATATKFATSIKQVQQSSK